MKLIEARAAEEAARKAYEKAKKESIECEIETAYESVPKGAVMVVRESEYYGSHSERGWRSGPVMLAVPAGVDISGMGIKHGTGARQSDDCWQELTALGVQEWGGDAWREIDLSWGPYHPDGETYEIVHLMDILEQISER